MPDVDWSSLFVFTLSPIELIIRGTVIYLSLFFLLRFVVRRDVGTVGIADLLMLVILADASQNAMSGGYESIADGLVLVCTLVAWNYMIDYLSFRFPHIRRLVQPGPLCLVRNGVKLRKNMEQEFVTDEELDAMLRERGVESVEEVKRAYLEADSRLSVIRRDRS